MSYPGLRILPTALSPSDLKALPKSGGNVDGLGRTIDYLRISLTDRCNLRCVYCMPEEGVALEARERLLSFEEIWSVAAATRRLGFRKFRITGGEPLVVKDFEVFLNGLHRAVDGATIAMTSNGVLATELVGRMPSLGVSRLNLSLDTLDADRFERLTRRRGLASVLETLDRAARAGFERVKINAVIVPGVNECDIVPLAGLARKYDIDVRFIEQMPLDGRADAGFVGADEILSRIDAVYGLEATPLDEEGQAAQLMYRSPGLLGRVGVIAPRSKKFCASCNRMRLTSTGELKGCLLSEGTLNLRDFLRQGASDSDLDAFIRYAIAIKPAEYGDDRYGLDRPMSAIGG